MSAVEALAEVLREHLPFVDLDEPRQERDGLGWYAICRGGGEDGCPWETPYFGTEAEAEIEAASHQTTAVVAAIRSMPAEQVAELIDGTVEHQTTFTVAAVPPSRVTTYATEAKRLKVGDTFLDRPIVSIDLRQIRACTPWLPLGVSPETNGEQK